MAALGVEWTQASGSTMRVGVSGCCAVWPAGAVFRRLASRTVDFFAEAAFLVCGEVFAAPVFFTGVAFFAVFVAAAFFTGVAFLAVFVAAAFFPGVALFAEAAPLRAGVAFVTPP